MNLGPGPRLTDLDWPWEERVLTLATSPGAPRRQALRGTGLCFEACVREGGARSSVLVFCVRYLSEHR